jgi:hypothetical protein
MSKRFKCYPNDINGLIRPRIPGFSADRSLYYGANGYHDKVVKADLSDASANAITPQQIIGGGSGGTGGIIVINGCVSFPCCTEIGWCCFLNYCQPCCTRVETCRVCGDIVII